MFKITPWILSGLVLAAPVTAGALMSSTSAIAQDDVKPVTPVVEETFNATEALAKANASLNKIDTAKGRFAETDPKGLYTQGTFYLSRPGRMRFVYDDPDPRLFVADGTMVAFEDRDWETVETVPLSATPLNLLIGKEADLAGRANVRSVTKKGGLVSVVLADKSGDTDGTLELFFDPASYDLKKWETSDAMGQTVTVDLFDVSYGMKLSPRLFQIDDPEDEDDRDR